LDTEGLECWQKNWYQCEPWTDGTTASSDPEEDPSSGDAKPGKPWTVAPAGNYCKAQNAMDASYCTEPLGHPGNHVSCILSPPHLCTSVWLNKHEPPPPKPYVPVEPKKLQFPKTAEERTGALLKASFGDKIPIPEGFEKALVAEMAAHLWETLMPLTENLMWIKECTEHPEYVDATYPLVFKQLQQASLETLQMLGTSP
jgi:hypothetical protein